MRRFATLPSLLALSFLATSCGDQGAGALFADIQYATRCDNVNRGCGGRINHDICGINGDTCDGVSGMAMLSCTAQDSGEQRILNFSATQGDGGFIRVTQARIAATGGGAGGASCSVRVTEGANTYEGACGSGTPTEAVPCQITNVDFRDDAGNPTVEGQIFCVGLKNVASQNLSIEVTAPGDGPMAMSSPGTFRIANCVGLTL